MRYICRECGENYDPIEAEIEFNTHSFGNHVYAEFADLCGDCAISEAEDMMEEEEEDEEENCKPIGCVACGGNWPECCDSCALYDD